MKPEHLKLLADKDWRLNNLYWITDKEGKPTRFRMTPEQREYFEGIHTRNIILKARQLGFTTEVCIIQLDAALFESAKCALIAHIRSSLTVMSPRRRRKPTRGKRTSPGS